MEPHRYSGDSAELNAGLMLRPLPQRARRHQYAIQALSPLRPSYVNGQPLDVQSRDLIGFEGVGSASAVHRQRGSGGGIACGVRPCSASRITPAWC